MLRIPLAAVLLMLLLGCGSPTNTIRLSAKAATAATLEAMDSSEPTALAVRDIAIIARDVTSDTGVDLELLRQQVLQQIAGQLSGTDELLMLALVDEIAQAIEAELEQRPALDLGTVTVYAHAAAVGAVQGADLYLLFHQASP